MTWIPISEFDNFVPVVPDPDSLVEGWVYPDYILTGIEPVPSGIPEDNPDVPSFHLARVIGQGSITGTYMLRTSEGWLLDDFMPHFSYQLGDFVYLITVGTWVIDISQRTYLPPIPPVPDYTPAPPESPSS